MTPYAGSELITEPQVIKGIGSIKGRSSSIDASSLKSNRNLAKKNNISELVTRPIIAVSKEEQPNSINVNISEVKVLGETQIDVPQDLMVDLAKAQYS